MTDIALTERWVATGDSARSAARAFVAHAVRRRASWVALAVFELAVAVMLGVSFSGDLGPVSRAVWGLAYALLPTAIVAVAVAGIAVVGNTRSFRRRLGAGVLLEAGFGEHAVALRGPLSSSVVSHDGIAAVKSIGDWVLLRQVGSPLWSVWPADLFPTEERARLERAVAAGRAAPSRSA